MSSVTPLQRERPGGERLLASGPPPRRRPPTAAGIARRRVLVTLAKYALPVAALTLLSSIALWPELARVREQGRVQFRRVFQLAPGAARLQEPRYRGVDERGRPYTITAEWAAQAGPQRVTLSDPKGDMVLENGSWMMVQSKEGTFIQHAGQLDLAGDVVLYRDDGTVMRTQAASLDMKNAAVASNEQTHAEGPFGVLDAQGFTLTDKGAAVEFHGPARLVLNGAQR